MSEVRVLLSAAIKVIGLIGAVGAAVAFVLWCCLGLARGRIEGRFKVHQRPHFRYWWSIVSYLLVAGFHGWIAFAFLTMDPVDRSEFVFWSLLALYSVFAGLFAWGGLVLARGARR